MNTAIELNNVSISYGSHEVVSDISLSVPHGKKTLIIGPNGSGKTTLIKTMLGLIEPTRGRVQVLGSSPRKVRTRVGYVPQRIALAPETPLTVFEFLSFAHRNRASEKLHSALRSLGVSHLSHQLVGTLSGGQLQRVLIARAIAHDPDILFLDEPSSGIDVGGEENFYELIASLHSHTDRTVVMISHELDVVHRVADFVLCLNKTLVCSGTPTEALTPETIQGLYGPDATIYSHHHNHA